MNAQQYQAAMAYMAANEQTLQDLSPERAWARCVEYALAACPESSAEPPQHDLDEAARHFAARHYDMNEVPITYDEGRKSMQEPALSDDEYPILFALAAEDEQVAGVVNTVLFKGMARGPDTRRAFLDRKLAEAGGRYNDLYRGIVADPYGAATTSAIDAFETGLDGSDPRVRDYLRHVISEHDR